MKENEKGRQENRRVENEATHSTDKDFRSLKTELGGNRLYKQLERRKRMKKVNEGMGEQRNYPQPL